MKPWSYVVSVLVLLFFSSPTYVCRYLYKTLKPVVVVVTGVLCISVVPVTLCETLELVVVAECYLLLRYVVLPFFSSVCILT